MKRATRLLVRANGLASLVGVAAIVLGGLWLVTAVSAFATEWHQLGGDGAASAQGLGTNGAWRLATSFTLSGQASWGYAMAAAIAFAAWVWVAREEARDALELLDEEDDQAEGY
jgi:hypothetical protein